MGKTLLITMTLFLAIFIIACEEEEFEFDEAPYDTVEPSEMNYVPAGEFLMGSDYSAGIDLITGVVDEGYYDEQPKHKVYVDAFDMDITEVTNAQYRTCVLEDACSDPASELSVTREKYYLDTDFDDFPVIYVSFWQAAEYCEWAGKRLPTEAEWEKAARGLDQRNFPWGFAQPDCTMADFSKTVSEYNDFGNIVLSEQCSGDTVRVSQFKQYLSPWGLLNMAGNVAEWTVDYYSDNYYNSEYFDDNNYNPQGPEEGNHRVVRGGSFADHSYHIRTAFRNHLNEETAIAYVGFRCAK